MKLLIVDDETALCKMLQEHFEKHFECEVLTANTPGDALELLEEELPEGMLLDVNLKSRLTGFDVLARARQISPATKVIMVTSVARRAGRRISRGPVVIREGSENMGLCWIGSCTTFRNI